MQVTSILINLEDTAAKLSDAVRLQKCFAEDKTPADLTFGWTYPSIRQD